MTTLTLLAVCGILLFSVRTCTCQTSGLRCYACAGCGDPFNANGVGVLVSDNCYGSCAKIKVGDLVSRSCFPIKTKEGCEESAGNIEACYCNSDKCNSSSRVSMSIIITVLITAIGHINIF